MKNEMIVIDREKLENAIARAKRIHPRVTWLGGRTFAVSGSGGNTYTVRFAVAGNRRLASCTCRAGEAGMLCFHVAAAASVNVAIRSMERLRQAA